MNTDIFDDEIVFNDVDSLPDPTYWYYLEAVCSPEPLSGQLIFEGLRKGLFPWAFNGEREWWCPQERAVLFLNELHVSRSLRKRIRQQAFDITFDKDFESTINGCTIGRSESWLDPELIHAMCELHEMGMSHSVECWQAGQLVGGVYGTDIGSAFVADSMFSLRPDASKVALFHLVEHLKYCGIPLIDCQVLNPHTQSLGVRDITRRDFLDYLACQSSSQSSRWQEV